MDFKFIVLLICLIVLSFNLLTNTKPKTKPKTKTKSKPSREYFFNINRGAFGGAFGGTLRKAFEKALAAAKAQIAAQSKAIANKATAIVNPKIGQSLEILPSPPPGYGNICVWSSDIGRSQYYLVKDNYRININHLLEQKVASVIQLPLDSSGNINFNGISLLEIREESRNNFSQTTRSVQFNSIKYSNGNYNVMNLIKRWANWIWDINYLNSEKLVKNRKFFRYNQHPIAINIYDKNLNSVQYSLQNEQKTITGISKWNRHLAKVVSDLPS